MKAKTGKTQKGYTEVNSSLSYLDKIDNLLGDRKRVDYLIINHMEPDHSGAIKILLQECS